ncbi:MAG: hypothetical protein HY866_19015 [Chloroflexi bacterium]|nr:hypothetical protein [Chloroflexota bacterium]
MDFDRTAFVEFLLRAKQATYASEGDAASVASLLPGAKQLEYREGRWLYRDIYFGAMQFTGQEVIYLDDTPLWTMCYNGGMIDPAASLGGFLKEAMRHVSADRPYRGPAQYVSGDYRYTDESHGSLDWYWGHEVITFQARPIYELRYSGGLIV